MQSGKEKSLKHHLGTLASTPEGLGFISRQKSLVLVNGKLYLKCKLKGEAKTTIVFIVPKAHRRKAIDGCHRDVGHQGQNRTASLLLERFWWPGMTLEVKSAVKNCKQCLHHDGDSVRAPLVPIEATGPMDLLHLDFTKIEVSGDCKKELKKKPEVVNVLVVTDHFTRHTMACSPKRGPCHPGGYRVDAVWKGEIPQASSWHSSLHPGGIGIYQSAKVPHSGQR